MCFTSIFNQLFIIVSNPKAKSGYSQIDHVVINPYGIFVIETKNYQDTIYGQKDRKIFPRMKDPEFELDFFI
ncbi:NERD domain-containing protein [Pseudalkalibacillus caeni]|uniref:NERD domain-containing protein n=1 Tax=Exobacillus caeni TaxID=2574798 RepID=A0A5R9F4Z3_9BACL|nr:NERD domain-containing protein [Pseudalkalibacillus caeni]